MEVTHEFGNDSKVTLTRCKSIMNIIRRVFSLREKGSKAENLSKPEIEVNKVLSDVGAGTGNQSASTSFSFIPNAPSVYEDPFVAVTADGNIHVKHYFIFNPKTEFHLDYVHLPHMKMLTRVIEVKKVKIVYYSSGMERTDEQVCKPWGMCRNDVWWASHLNRLEKGNIATNIVLDDGSTIRAGFSVYNVDAFAESIQCVGLEKDVPFQHGLPSPPFNILQIPFIDEDDEEIATNSEIATTSV